MSTTAGERKSGYFDWNDVCVLHPDFGLYPDAGRAFLADLKEPEACRYAVVDTRRAIVIALLDGKRTLRQVAEVLGYLCDLDAGTAAKAIENFMLTGNVPLIRTRDLPPGTKIREYNPAEFVSAGDRFSRKIRLSRPLGILWMPTLDCAVRCLYCYLQRQAMPRHALLPDRRNRELIRELLELKLLTLTVGGGDLFMHENIFDYLELLVSGGIVPRPISTKVPLNREQIHRLVEMGVKEVQYSIDGPNAEICDFLVRTPGWFERSVRTIRLMVEAGLRVIIHAILTGYNAGTAEETALFFHSLGVQVIKFSFYTRSIIHHRESLWARKTEVEKLKNGLDDLRSRCPGTEFLYRHEPEFSEMTAEEKQANFASRSRCSAYIMAMAIMPDGNCFGCEQTPQDDFYSMGNVRDKSILEVWNSKKAEELAFPPRELFKGTVCFDCPDFDRCHEERGYCFRMSYQVYGTIYAPAPNCPRAPKGLRLQSGI